MPEPTDQPAPDYRADVVIVGFGGAGACAALEAAAAGASVIVIDRFTGGGATALSGGVVYAGGGTLQQMEAGVTDSPDAMFDYLALEVGDAVTPATLRAFCEGSAGMVAWLAGHGVPFEGSLCTDKTSYPTNRHYLYYSGSELSSGSVAPPAPRGHRAVGRGTSGAVLFAPLAAAVKAAGVVVLDQTTARQLITNADGRVAAVAGSTLRGGPGPRWHTGCCIPGRPSPICTPPSSAGRCTGGWPGWNGGTAGRCRWPRTAAWCWPRAASRPAGR